MNIGRYLLSTLRMFSSVVFDVRLKGTRRTGKGFERAEVFHSIDGINRVDCSPSSFVTTSSKNRHFEIVGGEKGLFAGRSLRGSILEK